jgi:amino acid transporter
MSYFTNIVYTLESLGISDVLLPFILVFTVVFAIMQKVKPLGEETERHKPFNVVIALVMALAVVIPHVLGAYPPKADVVVIMNSALPQVSIVLVAILMVLLIVGLFGGKATWGGAVSGWLAFVAFLVIVYIFGRAAGWFDYLPNWLYWLDNPDTQAMLIVVAVFAIIIFYITKEPSEKGAAVHNVSKVGEALSSLFGGKKH